MEHSLPTTRAQKSAATRDRIFTVGRELFRQYGYDDVTVEMITSAAGVSVGSFYHFFGSKEGLLDEISTNINNSFSLPDDLDYQRDDCRERMLAFYKGYCDLMSDKSPDYMTNIFFGRRGNKTLLMDNRNYRRLMKEMLHGFQRVGKIRSDCTIDEAEEVLMICFFGVVYHWATCDFSYPLYGKIRAVLGSVLEGYLNE